MYVYSVTFYVLVSVCNVCQYITFKYYSVHTKILFYGPSKEISLKLEWLLTIANATETNGLTCLPKHGGARGNKFWSPILRLAIETGA
jgi:hypothetical protein